MNGIDNIIAQLEGQKAAVEQALEAAPMLVDRERRNNNSLAETSSCPDLLREY